MHFLPYKIKWYDWIWLIPFVLLIAIPCSLAVMLWGKFVAYCMDKK